MSWKKQKIAMPTTMAGILGFNPNDEIGGIKVEPKTFVIGVIVFIVLIKILSYILR